MSDQSRRKLLKSIAAGSGAVVAGKSLPESWSRPVVDSVMLPAHAQTSGMTLNSNGPITSGITMNSDSGTMMAAQDSLLDSLIPSAHAVPACAVNGQCATVNFLGNSGTVSVSNVGSGPFTLDASNLAGGTVGGIPFVLRLNGDRMAGNLSFAGDCGGYGAGLFPGAGCTPGAPVSGTSIFNQTQNVSHDFSNTKTLNVNFDVTGFSPSSDGILTLNLTDDFSHDTEYVAISVDGTGIGNLFAENAYTDCQPTGEKSITIPQATLQTAAADGTVTITMVATSGVGVCPGAANQVIKLEFTG